MKKLIILAVAVLSFSSMAQTLPKDEEAITKRLEKSNVLIVDAKKSLQASTWVDRASILIDAASVYTNKLIAGFVGEPILSQLGEPTSKDEVKLSDIPYQRYTFPDMEVYLQDGTIQYWKARKVLIPDALDKAYEDLVKAKSLDPKYFVNKGAVQVNRLHNEYLTEARSTYQLGKRDVAGKLFDGSYKSKELIGVIDTVSLYYAGVSYQEGGDYKSALERFEKALSFNYYDNGTIYYYIGACQEEIGEKEKGIETFETGFAKFPSNEAIMSGLINAYLSTGQNTNKLIEIVHQAQQLSPKNVSLYIVEATVWDKLGNPENSEKAMQKASEMDPNNFNVFYNYGVLKIMQSDALVTSANKLDYNDKANYDRLIKESIELQKIAITKLERAYELDPKSNATIDLLRQLYFPRRDDSPKMLERYNFFNDIYQSNK